MNPQSSDQERARMARTYFGKTPWPDDLNPLLRARPSLLEAYLKLSSVPWQTGQLSPRLRELIYVAVDAVPQQFYPEGIRLHTAAAYRAGAGESDIVSALSIAALVVFEGPIRASQNLGTIHSTQQEIGDDIRNRFVTTRGVWDNRLDALLIHYPALVSAWVEVLETTFGSACSLSAMECELVYVACLAAAQAPSDAFILPMAQARNRGASTEMLQEAIGLAAPLGLHVMVKALPETGPPQ
jgi:alkylhydroperoxidase/carboxymuconolactone decarboxylase family protein YurZ